MDGLPRAHHAGQRPHHHASQLHAGRGGLPAGRLAGHRRAPPVGVDGARRAGVRGRRAAAGSGAVLPGGRDRQPAAVADPVGPLRDRLLLLPVAWLLDRGRWWAVAFIARHARCCSWTSLPAWIYPMAFWACLLAVVAAGVREPATVRDYADRGAGGPLMGIPVMARLVRDALVIVGIVAAVGVWVLSDVHRYRQCRGRPRILGSRPCEPLPEPRARPGRLLLPAAVRAGGGLGTARSVRGLRRALAGAPAGSPRLPAGPFTIFVLFLSPVASEINAGNVQILLAAAVVLGLPLAGHLGVRAAHEGQPWAWASCGSWCGGNGGTWASP